MNSYSNYPDYIKQWWNERDIKWPEIDLNWMECRLEVNEILSRENELRYITQLIGEENLPEEQQLDLFIAKLIKNGFLVQNAFDNIDNFTDPRKMLGLIKIILLLYKEAKNLIKQGFIVEHIKELDNINRIIRICHTVPNDDYDQLVEIKNSLLKEIDTLKLMHGLMKTK